MKYPGFSIAPVMHRTKYPDPEAEPTPCYAVVREGTVVSVIRGPARVAPGVGFIGLVNR